MNRSDKIRFWWRWIAGPGALLICVILCWMTVPAWAAHEGEGRVGTWTVTQIKCGKGCHALGDFVSADGADRRTGVPFAGDPLTVTVGESLPALDSSGDSVYPPGNPNWWHDPVGALACSLVAAAWAWTVPVKAFRRRRQRKAAGSNAPR